jgi:DNA (cytosine-5)-methyltransferase 1
VNVLSLFAGIGGLDLGLERAEMTVVGQVEIDPFCRKVLTKHWPEVPRHDDVRTSIDWWQSESRPTVDVVAGGFPCQPFSSAGRRRGTADDRWGWPWMADVVRALRPRHVIVENVPALLDDGEAFGWVLGDLAALGFDADWSVFPACLVGAPHSRERLFVLADAAGGDGELPVHLPAGMAPRRAVTGAEGGTPRGNGWLPEPHVDRVAHGFPKRLVAPSLRALGNAVAPQVGEFVGRLVMGAAA